MLSEKAVPGTAHPRDNDSRCEVRWHLCSALVLCAKGISSAYVNTHSLKIVGSTAGKRETTVSSFVMTSYCEVKMVALDVDAVPAAD
jgi:hypothetical protein